MATSFSVPLDAVAAAVGHGHRFHGAWLREMEPGAGKIRAFARTSRRAVPVPHGLAGTLLEVFGGAALVLGVLVTLVSIPLVISMVVAILTVQGRYGFSSVNTIGLTPSGPLFGPPGYEINLLYVAGLMALALSEPTALSIDHLLDRYGVRFREPQSRA